MLCFFATSAIASKSGILRVGLPMVSRYKALVFSSINSSKSSGLSSFANRASIPNFWSLPWTGYENLRKDKEKSQNYLPDCKMLVIVMNCAGPDATAKAATPPCKAVIFFKTSVVGFIIRVDIPNSFSPNRVGTVFCIVEKHKKLFDRWVQL